MFIDVDTYVDVFMKLYIVIAKFILDLVPDLLGYCHTCAEKGKVTRNFFEEIDRCLKKGLNVFHREIVDGCQTYEAIDFFSFGKVVYNSFNPVGRENGVSIASSKNL